MNSSGSRVAELRYRAFGETRYNGTPSGTPTDYRFTGQRQDSYIKLYQIGSRWYDSELGRWTSPDSMVPDPANPQSLNRYSYGYNNPVKFRDPTGHYGEPFWEKAWNWLVDQYNKVSYGVREWWAYHNPCGMSVDPMCRAFSLSPPKPSVPSQPLLVDSGQIERMREIGRWIDRAESMSAAARAYQRFISGRSDDLVFEVEGVSFDSFDETQGLLEDAKAIPNSLIDLERGEFQPWVSGTTEWLKQAERQVEAAGGLKIVWYFSTEAARDAMYRLFLAENPDLLENIDLVYEPME